MDKSVTNRRTHPRVPFEHQALLLAPEGDIGCMVRNSCPGGMLVDIVGSDHGAKLNIGRKLPLSIRVMEDGKPKNIQITSEIRFRGAGALGLQFLDYRRTDIKSLLQLSSYYDKVIASANRRTAPHPLLGQFLTAAAAETLEQVSRSLSQIFTETGQDLFAQETSAMTNSQNAEVDLFQNFLLTNMNAVATATGHALVEQLSRAINPPTAEGQSIDNNLLDADHLSLVDKEDFETWLAQNTAELRLENALEDELYHLKRLFRRLGADFPDTKHLPCAPGPFFSALNQQMDLREWPVFPRRMLYKRLGTSLATSLSNLYKSFLKEAGRLDINSANPRHTAATTPDQTASNSGDETKDFPIPPHLDAASDTSAKSKASPMESATPHTDHQPSSTAGQVDESGFLCDPQSIPDHQLLQNAVEQLQGAVSQLQSNALHGFSGNPPLSAGGVEQLGQLIRLSTTALDGQQLEASARNPLYQSENDGEGSSDLAPAYSEVGDILSAIEQLHSTADQPHNDGKGLQERVQIQLASAGQSLPLATNESTLIDLSEQLLVRVIENWAPAKELKGDHDNLQLALAKISLLDPEIYSNTSHPVRHFFNRLEQLELTGTSNDDSVERFVNRFSKLALENFHGSSETFSELLQELERQLQRQEILFKRKAERIANDNNGRQKLANARYRVITDLADRIGNRKIPKILYEFLEEAGWRDYLVMTVLHEGADSSDYIYALEDIDRLLFWIGGSIFPSVEDCLQDFRKEVPAWLEMVSEELMQLGRPVSSRILEKLGEHLLYPPRQFEWVEIGDYQWTGEGSHEITQLGAPATLADDVNIDLAHQINVGDWVDIRTSTGNVRMRLAWKGEDCYRFVFIGAHGMEEMDLALEELVARAGKNELQLVDAKKTTLFERSLTQVVSSACEDISSQGSVDPLTGLLNRQEFEHLVERTLAEAIQHKTDSYVAFVDVDQFRLINHSFGSMAGDRVLVHISELMKPMLENNTICARIGGNEFGLVFKRLPLEAIRYNLEKIREQVADNSLVDDSYEIKATISIGVAKMLPRSDTVDSILRKAQLACQKAKDSGRNRVVEYNDDDSDQRRENELLSWIQKIDSDIDSLLCLRCQEIRPVNSGDSLSHYEILLGVKDDNGKLCPPDVLIEAAERFHRIAKVDEWVVNHTLDWMEQHSEYLNQLDGLSINLSGASMDSPNFHRYLLGRLRASTLPLRKLCFEVTETAAVNSLENAQQLIAALKRLGCKIALDDFGTGQSSYAYIQALPADFLKIDGVFIRNILENKTDQALVASITQLAHFIGMKTIAEFVENEDIISMLRDLGIDKIQGYGVHKPQLLNTLDLSREIAS